MPRSPDLRTLCCEGSCSRALSEYREQERTLRSIGYSAYNLRGTETAHLAPTRHYFVRSYLVVDTRYHVWACATCGCERVYGADEI